MVKYSLVGLLMLHCVVMRAQVLEFAQPSKLPANVNSEAEEAMPIISPDGNRLYFTRALSIDNVGGKYSGHDVWLSEKNELQAWAKANNTKLSFNSEENTAVIGISADGNTLYLMNTTPSKKINGIYFSKKKNTTWSEPEFVSIPGLDGNGAAGFYVSPSFDVIVISMRGADTRGEEDLYISTKSGAGWTIPKNLGPVINTTGFEISPFLSADKKRLYFSSNGHQGSGDGDIFYCDKLYDSWETWSAPRNLGTKINSEKFDGYFSIYGDTIAYFASNRGGKMADIYTAKVFPGDEVYAITQRYMADKEMNEVLGGNVSRKITFEKNTVELAAAQKELLYFISNKLLRRTDINFHIVVNEENDPSLSEQRQNAVYNFMRQSGIESYRIQVAGKAKNSNKAQNGVVEIVLFK